MKSLAVLLLLVLLFQQSYSLPYLYELGTTVSSVSLALAVPHYFFFRSHHSLLDYVQLTYLFRLLWSSSNIVTFSNYLNNSWITFMPTFWTSLCDGTQFLCNVGYSASFGTVLVGFILLCYIAFLFQRCRKPGILFLPFFNLFKGFIRWIYVSLTYASFYYLIQYLQGVSNGSILANLVAPLIVLGIAVLYPWAQLLFVKLGEGEDDNTKPKWAELLGVIKVLLVCGGVAINNTISVYGCVPVFVGIVGYAVGYNFLYEFQSPIAQRIVSVLVECALISIYSLFLWAPSYVQSYNLDFFFTAAVFVIEFFFEIFRYIKSYRSVVEQQTKVVDEDSAMQSKANRNNNRKNNSFAESTQELNVMDNYLGNSIDYSKRELKKDTQRKIEYDKTPSPSVIKKRR